MVITKASCYFLSFLLVGSRANSVPNAHSIHSSTHHKHFSFNHGIFSWVLLKGLHCLKTVLWENSEKYNEWFRLARIYTSVEDMLLNKILVCWSVHSKANLLTLGWDEEKCSVYCKAEQWHGLLIWKIWYPWKIQVRVLKGKLRERTTSCVMDSFSVLWLEVTGWCHKC